MVEKDKSNDDSSDDSQSKSVISQVGPDPTTPKSKPKSSDGSLKSKNSKPRTKPKSSEHHSSSKGSQASKDRGKEKKKSCDKSKSRTKSSDGQKSKNKPKSADGHKKSKSKAKEGHGKKHSKHSKDGKNKAKVESAPAEMTPKDKKSIGDMVRKIEATKGATAVSNDNAIGQAGFVIECGRLYQSEYSQVLRAKKTGSKNTAGKLVVKVVNLTECSPRSRANLLQNSVRIMRFVSGIGDKSKEPISPLFIVISDIYLASGLKLFIFMAECNSSRSLYDLVKSNQSQSAADIRTWTKAVANGVHELQRIGVAHRAVKLQHILFDYEANPKLCGWGKSVFYYEPNKKRILLQRKERRVRHNYQLPPEAFMGSYNPAKADIWSIGVILVAMCTKRYPFNVRDSKTKFSSQWREFVKSHELNTHVRNLCHKLFIIDPKRRISSGDILADKYFKVTDDKLALQSCKIDPNSIKVNSRVGGMSAIDIGENNQQNIPKAELPKFADTPADEDEAVNWAEEEKADPSGTNADATGNEGGNVGEEENLPAEEQEAESQMAEKVAPEEAEEEAQPEDGEVAQAAEEEGAEEAEAEE